MLKHFQVLGQLHGRRARRCDAGLPALRGAGYHPAPEGSHADEDHLPVPQEGQADPPAAHDGG